MTERQEYLKRWYEERKKDPEFRRRRSEYYASYYKSPKGQVTNRRAHLKLKYGITLEQYDEMHKKQNGVCAICKKPCRTGQRLGVDHNHSTGQKRGLLCMACNRAIGLLEEKISYLASAARYLAAYTKKEKE
jgi:hypothetical protein